MWPGAKRGLVAPGARIQIGAPLHNRQKVDFKNIFEKKEVYSGSRSVGVVKSFAKIKQCNHLFTSTLVFIVFVHLSLYATSSSICRPPNWHKIIPFFSKANLAPPKSGPRGNVPPFPLVMYATGCDFSLHTISF